MRRAHCSHIPGEHACRMLPTCEAGQQRREQRSGLDQEAGARGCGELQANGLRRHDKNKQGGRDLLTHCIKCAKPSVQWCATPAGDEAACAAALCCMQSRQIRIGWCGLTWMPVAKNSQRPSSEAAMAVKGTLLAMSATHTGTMLLVLGCCCC